MAEVPNVAVAAVNVLLALLDGNVVLLGVGDGVFTRINVPLAPRRNNLHVGRDGFVGQFEADLVVAFAGAAVRKAVGSKLQRDFRLALGDDAVGSKLQRDFRLALGDDGPRHGSAEQISVLVNRSGAERRPNVIADEFFAQVFDVRGSGAGGERFLARGFEIFLLADVADHGDNFAGVIFLEPGDDDGGVQPAGIGEYDFFRFGQLCFHDSSLAFWRCRVGAQHAAPLQRQG